jgi:hypothetical protein
MKKGAMKMIEIMKYQVEKLELDKSVTQTLYGVFRVRPHRWYSVVTADINLANIICHDINESAEKTRRTLCQKKGEEKP